MHEPEQNEIATGKLGVYHFTSMMVVMHRVSTSFFAVIFLYGCYIFDDQCINDNYFALSAPWMKEGMWS